jgi:hypothetical protein
MTFFFTHWFNYKGAAFGSLPPHTSEPLSPQGLFHKITEKTIVNKTNIEQKT